MKINRIVVALTILCSWQMLNTAPFIPHAYVANGGSVDGGSVGTDQTVSVINTMTDMVVATVTLSAQPTYNGIAITPDNATVLVTCSDGTVNRIDVTTNTLLTPNIPLGLTPGNFAQSIAIAPNGLYAYVTCTDSTIRRIDLAANMVDVIMPTGGGLLLDIAVAPDGLTAYACDQGLAHLLSIDLTNNTFGAYAAIPGSFVRGLLIYPTAPYLYVGQGGNTSEYYVFNISDPLAPVIAIAPNACADPMTFGDSAPISFSLSLDGQYLYICCYNSYSISISTATLNPMEQSCIFAGSPGWYATFMSAVTPDGTKLYVTDNGNPTIPAPRQVSVFSLYDPAAPTHFLPQITVGQNPAGIAITKGPPAPPPPNNALGRLFFLNSEEILDITWTASTSSDVVSYNIYLDNVLIGTVPANGPLVFQTPFKASYLGKTFYVAAVSSFGVESIRVPVVIGSGQGAPTNVKGVRRQNVFLNSLQCILVMSWIASDYPSVDIASYLIYRDNTIIGIVSADDLLCFQTCIRASDCGKIFYVAAVDSDGRVSNRVPVEIV